MNSQQLMNHAETLDTAFRNVSPVPQLSLADKTLTPGDAYAIQAASIERRLQRGERRIGMKMGLTSRAKMVQVGVDEMIWGRLTDAMLVEEGGTLSRMRFVHPRIEPEVAFLLKSPLSGVVTAAQALAAVEAVAPAMEVIDSRFENFKFTLVDVVADNASSSGLVVGGWCKPDADVSNLGVILQVNGRVVEVGSTAAILGHPLRSLVAAARLVGASGEELRPGDIVMSGAATAAHPLSVGEVVRATVQNLGTVSLTVGP